MDRKRQKKEKTQEHLKAEVKIVISRAHSKPALAGYH